MNKNCFSFKECNNKVTDKGFLCVSCKAELDCFHDTIFDCTGKDLVYSELVVNFNNLPQKIKNIGIEWGLCDTEFRNMVYSYCEETTNQAKCTPKENIVKIINLFGMKYEIVAKAMGVSSTTVAKKMQDAENGHSFNLKNLDDLKKYIIRVTKEIERY